MFFLTGCVQNTALLGPAITVASTGNVYQAGLSYGSGKAITKLTGKNTMENVKNFLDKDKDKDKKADTEKANEFFKIVKKINKSSSIKNLASQ
tara:strand:- start:248 stop:526 length:279 start_codon:yes stop_codon:yes gene_type:complete